MPALPRETVIEHQHVMGSTPPFPHQPGSRFQLGARAYRDGSGFIELPRNPEQLALRLGAEGAPSHLLHSIGDGSQQQLAAEVRGCRCFVETTPLPTQFADVEPEEARERLRTDRILSMGSVTDRG